MFSLMIQNWIGLVIGLGVAALLCLVLGFTAFKNNKIAGTIISILLVVVFVIAGVFVQDYFFTRSDPTSAYYDVIKDPKIDVVDADKYLTIKSNGGKNRTFIEKELETAEITTDKFFDISMTEYKEIVIFHYSTTIDDNDSVVNVIMNKTDNSLAFDGCINVYVEKKGDVFLFWDTREYIFHNEMFKGNNFNPLKYPLDSVNGPTYYCTVYEPANSVLLNNKNASLSLDRSACKVAQIHNLLIYNNYFQQLGDLGLMLYDNQSIFKQMNNFYTSIYKSIKKSEVASPLVDVTNNCAYLNKIDNKFYNCHLFLNVNFKDYSSQSAFALGMSKNQEHENNLKDNVDTDVIDYITLPNIKVLLSPRQNIDMSTFDITKAPVKITLRNSKISYEFLFDTRLKFGTGIQQGIQIGVYDIIIESNVLSLGNYSVITITKDSDIIKFLYDYEYNTILTKVSLNPLSNFDFSNIDLVNNPVTITLNNGTSSYNFVFDSIDKLSQTLTKRLPMGEYIYSIVSNELAFDIKNGQIQIDVNNYSFVFNYDYRTNVEYECVGYTFTSSDSTQFYYILVGSEVISEEKVQSVVLFDTFKSTNSTIQTYTLYEANDLLREQISPLALYATEPIDRNTFKDGLHLFQLVIEFKDNTRIVTNVLHDTVVASSNNSYYGFSISVCG